ncbi:NAD+ synthase [Candidatus Hecatella orcuttiae]|uniref:NAD+ synthase n=1 Tax=Candidatus Hecatella orcuttiae TaxID=1935119 RepID=UPI0028681710|nr:NAD+ synthase [Candidatus Hecatella orcuttiae]
MAHGFELSEKLLRINPEAAAERLTALLKRFVEQAQASCAVVGLSGGVDSSVVAKLAVEALGKDRVVGVSMPEKETVNLRDVEDAGRFAGRLGIRYFLVDISDPLKAVSETVPVFNPSSLLAKGNLKARMRMLVLYYFANRLQGVVLGTGNRSEILTGYFTKHGDGASDVLPLGGLYKTQVYQLAAYLDIPPQILRKTPSPGLWPGQTDEGELGIRYQTLDLVLYGLERGLSPRLVARRLGLPLKTVLRVCSLKASSEHKRSHIPILMV